MAQDAVGFHGCPAPGGMPNTVLSLSRTKDTHAPHYTARPYPKTRGLKPIARAFLTHPTCQAAQPWNAWKSWSLESLGPWVQGPYTETCHADLFLRCKKQPQATELASTRRTQRSQHSRSATWSSWLAEILLRSLVRLVWTCWRFWFRSFRQI